MSQKAFELPPAAPDLSLQVLAWMYGLALDCGGRRTLINNDYFTGDDVTIALGTLQTESALGPNAVCGRLASYTEHDNAWGIAVQRPRPHDGIKQSVMDVTVPAVTSRTTLLRQWEMLKLLPSRSPGATASHLHQRLAEAGYNTSKRTVERDLNELSRLFPLQCNDKSAPYGWYWQPGKSAELPGLTLSEALTLRLLEDSLRPLIPTFMLKALEPRFILARDKLNIIAGENESARWLSKVASVQPSITQLPPEVNSAILDTVQQALLSECQLHCHYHSARNNQQREFTLNPLGLVQRGQVTYLIATVGDYSDQRQFALHRFSQARPLDSPCKVPEGFQLQRYIDSGAMQFGSSEKIQLKARISEGISRLLRETPLSDDMQITPDAAGLQLTATVSNSWELRWWILSHAPAVIVEAPLVLREDIGRRLREAVSAYGAAV